jgi:hypothetical protein
MRVGFFTSQIDVRGTCVALYDYALYNEELLMNSSLIITDARAQGASDDIAVKKFRNRFRIAYISSLEELKSVPIDVLYLITYGKESELFNSRTTYPFKLLVHCVFDMSEPHGDAYFGVSSAVAKKYGRTEYLPHMIGLQKNTRANARAEYRIPPTALVFGRYGGVDTFNIEFCKRVISRVVRSHRDIYFFLGNVERFDTHPQIVYPPLLCDSAEKSRFIATCDAYIECGTLGHSFGLAIGEFAVADRSIILYKGTVWNTAHYEILGDSGIYFSNEEEFEAVITTFTPRNARDKYAPYTPSVVMSEFAKLLKLVG